MDALSAHDVTLNNGETTRYYEGGAADGLPLIFIHGWPDVAAIWTKQLAYFTRAGMRFRVLALDMRGYGGSSAPRSERAYALEQLVGELVDFAQKTGIEQAVWVGHDWGSGVVSALAAHHPALCRGIALLSVPYRTIELGLDALIAMVNRDIYPAAEFPYGQFDYMRYYEAHPRESVAAYETNTAAVIKTKYARHDASQWGKPGRTSTVSKDGGWFKGHPEAVPDMPLDQTVLDPALNDALLQSYARTGFFPPTAYYLNHAANAAYAQSALNAGVLTFPVLYIDAKFDAICSPSTTPKMADGQAACARSLTYRTIDAGHWLQLECPDETNETLSKWLGENF